MLAHNVYFTLNDSSPAAIDRMVTACHRYLKNHKGVIFFGAGTCGDEFARPVNDRMYHVALHVVFIDKAAHDDYQVAESHQLFITENKDNWRQVRVFDSYVE